MNLKKILGVVLLIGLIVTALAFATANKPAQTTGKLRVAATFYPLYEFSKQVGGDLVEVKNITPAAGEPHDFEPSPQVLIDTQQAHVLVYNGAAFEPWVDKFLPDYKNTVIKASAGMELMGAEGGTDPHYWLDPVLAQTAVDTIRDGLIAAAPEHKDAFTLNANTYKSKLAKLDTDFTTGLASCSQRTIVASHDAFSYVGRRYAIEILAIAGINPDQEPSAGKLAEISTAVRQKDIKYIFFERLVSPRLADTIATETGAQTATLDPIEGMSDEDQEQGKDYLSVQYENLAALQTALGCR